MGGVTKSGLFVALPDYGADGFIPISTLGMDYFIYDEAHRALSGEKTGLGYRLGDSVRVKLVGSKDHSRRSTSGSDGERGAKCPHAVRSFHKGGRRDASRARKQAEQDPREGVGRACRDAGEGSAVMTTASDSQAIQCGDIDATKRPLSQSMQARPSDRCPACSSGKLFQAFLKPVDNYAACGEAVLPSR